MVLTALVLIGWDFLSRIKQIPSLARIPVVVISILADRNKGFALGSAAVIQKPVSKRELYESLVELGLLPRNRVSVGGVRIVEPEHATARQR